MSVTVCKWPDGVDIRNIEIVEVIAVNYVTHEPVYSERILLFTKKGLFLGEVKNQCVTGINDVKGESD